MIFAGKARIVTEDVTYYVQRGDIVCTQAGDEHDFLEVYEDIEMFWFEDSLLPGGRTGRLHRDVESSKGHIVAAAELPANFPVRLAP